MTQLTSGAGIPRRVAVVGSPGAGKTTFARALAARLGVPHVELDALFHGPGWTPTPADEMRARIAAAQGAGGWVVDGNYARSGGDQVRRSADTVVWLDLPRRVVMRRVLLRTLGRITRGTELWNGNRERLRNLFDRRPEENIVLWTWTQFGAYRTQYERESAAAAPGVTWVRLRSRAEADTWLARVPDAVTS